MGFIKKNLLKLIECSDFKENTLVKKFEYSDRYEIMKGSKLVVRAGQAAIFVHKGQIADVFYDGSYKLDTDNLPILSKIAAWKYGFEMTNLTDIYFVSMVQQTNLKWGTTNPIMLRDKDFGLIRLMGHGEYAFRVKDPAVFLREYFGTLKQTTTDRIQEYLKAIVLAELTDTLGEAQIPALDLAAKYIELGDLVRQRLDVKFGKLGLEATEVIIKNLKLPEAVEAAMDKRTEVGVMGGVMGEYAAYESVGAMRDAARNPGMGGMMAGMGVGMGVGGVVGGTFAAGMAGAASSPTVKKVQCGKCGNMVDESSKFCPHCGGKIMPSGSTACPKCGGAVPAGSKFCPTCGTPMTVKCPKCGKDLPLGTAFCPDCGSKI